VFVTHHRVLSPVSLAFWYSGSVGTTVGSDVAVALVANGTEAKAWMGSTIMASVMPVYDFSSFVKLIDECVVVKKVLLRVRGERRKKQRSSQVRSMMKWSTRRRSLQLA